MIIIIPLNSAIAKKHLAQALFLIKIVNLNFNFNYTKLFKQSTSNPPKNLGFTFFLNELYQNK